MTETEPPGGGTDRRAALAAREPLCSIRGLGRHLPERELTNRELERLVDTDDEWIVQRTGIRSRRVMPEDWITSDLAVAAVDDCLSDAKASRSEIDMLVLATVTPDHLCPSTACVAQRKLGLDNVPAFDISAACSGFGYGLTVATGLVRSGLHRNVMVVGAEAMTRFMNYEDRTSCILFGDGAGAALVSREGRLDVLATTNGADGSLATMIEIPGGGSREPASSDTLAQRRHFVRMKGREVFRTAVRQMTQSTIDTLESVGLRTSDIDWLIPHQANARIIEAVGESLGLPSHRVVVDMADKGNTTAASIPIALTGVDRDGGLEPGQVVVLVGFGAGAAWSCQVLRVRA